MAKAFTERFKKRLHLRNFLTSRPCPLIGQVALGSRWPTWFGRFHGRLFCGHLCFEADPKMRFKKKTTKKWGNMFTGGSEASFAACTDESMCSTIWCCCHIHMRLVTCHRLFPHTGACAGLQGPGESCIQRSWHLLNTHATRTAMQSHVLKVHDPKGNGMIATHSDLVAFSSSLEFQICWFLKA